MIYGDSFDIGNLIKKLEKGQIETKSFINELNGASKKLKKVIKKLNKLKQKE